MPPNTVSLNARGVYARAIVGTTFEALTAHWDIQSQGLKDSMRNLMVVGPHVNGQVVDLVAAHESRGENVKPNLIFEAIKSIDCRTCCFWELAWLTHELQKNEELWRSITPIIALSSSFSGLGRNFIALKGSFQSPVIGLVQETSIGDNRYKYLISHKFSSVPQLQKVAA